MLAFDVERQLRGAHLRVQAMLAEVVAVEGHVEHAQRRLALAELLEQGAGDPHAAGVYADEERLVDAAAGQVGAQVGGHLREQDGRIRQGHGLSSGNQCGVASCCSSQPCSSRAAARASTGRSR
ncbi:hypothetical protein D3C78_1634900 [compost metagenome]